jgi:hypothetical protein
MTANERSELSLRQQSRRPKRLPGQGFVGVPFPLVAEGLLLEIGRCPGMDGSTELLLQAKVIAVIPELDDLASRTKSEDVHA